MKILVIGGAGYIGSHVTRALLDKKYKVCVYDNLSSGRAENIFPEVDFVKGDILDYPFLVKTMNKGFEGLIHLAAFKAAGESMVKPEKYSLNNISGTINILNAASTCQVQRIIFSSSAAVYGEPQYIPIDEKHQLRPANYYGFTKLEIERFLDWYDRLKNLRYASLRYFNAAGYDSKGRIKGLEKNPENLLPIVMEVASGWRDKLSVYGNDYETRDGTGLRDYIHVSDLAEAHVLAFTYLYQNNKSITVNLGSESGITVHEMITKAREITGQAIPTEIVQRRPGDPATVLASASYARKKLGWKAQHSDLETLIKSTWNVYSRFH